MQKLSEDRSAKRATPAPIVIEQDDEMMSIRIEITTHQASWPRASGDEIDRAFVRAKIVPPLRKALRTAHQDAWARLWSELSEYAAEMPIAGPPLMAPVGWTPPEDPPNYRRTPIRG
jgi:hypothetical protein